MSAVKNLRAMFEQKGDISPPERGRSPGIPHGPDSPRPLSKVRTSFVAIEKDGRIGLQREGSQDSISAIRKLSGDSNAVMSPTAGTPTAGSEKSNPFEGVLRSPARMTLRTQPIFESPKADSAKPDAAVPAEEPQSVKQVTAPASDAQPKVSTPNGEVTKEGPSESVGSLEGEVVKTNGLESGKEPQKTAEQETSKPATRTTKSAPKPLSVPSRGKPGTKAEKSPTAQKGPRTPPATSTHHPAPKKTPEKKAQPPENPVTPQTTAASAKPSGASSIKKPSSIQSSPAHTTFVKPKPRSPTRPIKLPPSLTTHTAASGSKVNVPRQSMSRTGSRAPSVDTHARNAPRQSMSRAGGRASSVGPHGRPASRASGSAAGNTHNPALAKGPLRQNSTASRPRPTVGPPPKQPTKENPPAKSEKEVDQSFLARMMRPTKASASKVAERVHTSPPRKATAGPKKVATTKPIKKTVAKSTGTAASSKQAQDPAADANNTTADADRAAAVEVDELANSAAAAGQKTSIDAPIAEQCETADDEAAGTQASTGASADEQPAKEAKAQPRLSPTQQEADGSDEKSEAGVAAAEGLLSAETAVTEEKGDAPETTAA